jgi:nicotinamidase/pyrazinamidase
VTRGLLIVDVQNDFCEGGALGVDGGRDVASRLGKLLEERTGTWPMVWTSRDVHNPLPDLNGGHFAAPGKAPDYLHTWPVHCVRYTPGAELHSALLPGLRARLGRWSGIVKGVGRPDYSAFQGHNPWTPENGIEWEIQRRSITELDVVGLATDYCVYQSTLDALKLPQLREVRVVTDLCAGVAEDTVDAALEDMRAMGARLITTAQL